MTAFLVNDTVALDAGWLTGALTLEEQERVKDIFISHSHLDHTATLPFLIDNNFSAEGFSLRIYAIAEVIKAMKDHLFNNLTWPDFSRLPNDFSPVLRLVEIEAEKPTEINGLEITPVRVSHLVSTTGFVVDDGKSVMAFSSDTGPTERFWEYINDIDRLAAVITETSFPNKLQHIADVSGHLTPQTLGEELKKLKRDVPVYLYGFKPRHLETIENEVKSLGHAGVEILEQGKTYDL